MLKSLHIKNLATIENIELELEEGFSILTGETGTGKSIIIDGIRLALGEKGTPDIIRTGEAETSVEAIFFLPQKIKEIDHSLSKSENDLYIQRKISEKETGRGYINGTLVPIKKLREISPGIADIYGQNDHVFLHNTENQLDYLDYFASTLSLRNEVSHASQKLKRLIKEKKEIKAKITEKEQRLDFLKYQINEIENAELDTGEEDELRQKRNILKNSEKIHVLVKEALDIAYSRENSITPLASRLQDILEELKEFDKEFKDVYEVIGQFSINIREFSDFLLKFKEKQTSSPEKLETIEQRLSLIEKLKRKYGGPIEDIFSFLERAKKEYSDLSLSEEKLTDLNTEIGKFFNEYKSKAQKLCILRKKEAIRLEEQIKKEIARLGMKKAKFKIDFKSYSPNLDNFESLKNKGTEEVEFLISPNPGEDLKPLRKIASGGELSRIMLALKSIGKEIERLKILIFDEIDSGIGGKTAECVAQKLKDLSAQNQVICITHLPQIASFANHHYKIEKKIKKNRTYTSVKKLTFKERINEVARLLAGSHVTDIALQNAKEMLEHNLGINNTSNN